MPSIEGAFIGLARYIRDHFPDLSWMPLWYGGIPFPDSYPPLLHAFVALLSGVCHISAGLAYHAAIAVFYSLGPVTLYWAARRMGAMRLPAFLAALGYSLLSPSLWLAPVLRHDIGGWLMPCRLDAMVRWGEGPHATSLMLLAVSLGLLHVAIQRRQPQWYFAAAVAMAAVALSNWIGSFALAMVVGSYLLAGFSAQWPPSWGRMALMGVWAYALAAPFVTPSTAITIQANAPIVAGGYKPNHSMELIFVAGTLLLAWVLHRLRIAPDLRFAILLTWVTAAITLLAFWFKLWMVPQPERYHLEMDMAFWLLVALLASRIRAPKVTPKVRLVLLVAALGLCVPVAMHQHRYARSIEKPMAIRSTAEYEISHWLGEHMPGQRVFAPGSIGFWMLCFSDTPMLVGGFDNGMRNTVLQDIDYQIYAGDRQDTMLAWLKAFGVAAIAGGGPDSREAYHPYAHPDKFAGLAEIWRDGPEVIYRVPRARSSLAHAMHSADLVVERPPTYYTKPLENYLIALDDPAYPDANFQWRGTGKAEITGNLKPEQILSVQIAWDKGWNASVGGQSRRTWQDKLGQMVVAPQCNGPCTVELAYDGGLEQQGARWLCVAGWLAGFVSLAIFPFRKRVSS
jgi:hypothetical protein